MKRAEIDSFSIATHENIVNPTPALSLNRLHLLTWGLAFGLTDVGPVRATNEDNFLIDEALQLLMVADGMGGHAAGAVASAATLVAVREYLQRAAVGATTFAVDHLTPPALLQRDPDSTQSDPNTDAVALLTQAVRFANTELHAQSLANRALRGMGTTLTGLWRSPDDEAVLVFHVGDSRLYRYRAGALSQLTHDQTLYQQALDMGAIENLPARNFLLQAVGPAPDVTPEVRALRVLPGDVLMLCSDGLHGSVPHGDIEQTLADASAATLAQASARLIALAKEYGVRDNITVLLVWCSDAGA